MSPPEVTLSCLIRRDGAVNRFAVKETTHGERKSRKWMRKDSMALVFLMRCELIRTDGNRSAEEAGNKELYNMEDVNMGCRADT